MMKRFMWVALGIVIGAAGYALAQQATKVDHAGLKQRVLLEQALPEKLDGKEAKVTVLELERAPGSAGAPHRHPGPVFVYVLDGELESAIDGQSPKVYTKGQMFYEPPRALHRVSRNPSKTTPVRFLAFLLTAKDEKQLVIPEKP
ncbi:MAG TPA: cupin domain-containing protein [Gemmataceae bacterium]|nr:cupin domain-containing protein [Gemmataceae bacterium]